MTVQVSAKLNSSLAFINLRVWSENFDSADNCCDGLAAPTKDKIVKTECV